MRGVAACDVAGGDLGCLQLGVGKRQRAAVVRLARDAGDGSRAARIDNHDLALRCGVPRLEHRLAVETEIAVALLHDAVRLARDNEAVVTEAHVERLAAAPEREQDAVRVTPGDGADRDRPFE